MKLKLLIIFLLCSLSVFCTDYYVGVGGNNSNSGTSIPNRWADITKVNGTTFSAGDRILFANGETFVGSLIPKSNGITISGYIPASSSTVKPIITGLVTLTGWTSLGGGIWICTPSRQLKSTCNIFTVNGVPYEAGRTPNANNYFTYSSANTTTLTSSSLVAPYNNMTGAEIVIKKNAFIAEKMLITSQAGTTVTYVRTRSIDNGGTPTVYNGTAGYGFFLQRFAASLDLQNEWFYDSATNKMRIYSTVNPSAFTIKASFLDTVIYLGSHTNITISNVNVEGGSLYGVYGVGGTNIFITDNDFNCNTRAIFPKGGVNININNNVIRNSMSNAISVSTAKQINILNNTIINTGVFLGMGLFWGDHSMKGIGAKTDATTASNWLNIIGNTVQTTGYMSIDFRGSNATIRRNIVDTFCFHIDDGGGIYTWVNNSSIDNTAYLNRIIDSNFVSNCIGAPAGTTGTTIRGNGIYIDDQAKEITIKDNTVWNIPSSGIIMNNPRNNIVTNNTVYNAGIAHKINMKPYGAISGNFVKRNVFYQKVNTQYNFAHINYNLSIPTPITITQSLQGVAFIDTNWITNTKTNGYTYYYSTNGSGTTFPPDFNLATWRSSYGHDLVSVLPPVPVTNTNTTLHINPSDNLLVLDFAGFRKRDPKGNIYDHTATVGRWGSLILIDDGLAPSAGNIPPIANAGSDISITLPVNFTSISGSGSTDQDGTIVSYAWVKLPSSPASGTIATPNSVNTNLTGLVQGIYTFELTVTDNLGETSKDIVAVTVNPAPNNPPVANAGSDITITLPINTATISGSAMDDGVIVSHVWTKVAGSPSNGSIDFPNNYITNLSGLVQGTYQFLLTVTDNGGLTGTDIVIVVVNPAIPPANQPPVVTSISPDATITLPNNSVSVNISGSEPNGTIVGYSWTLVPSSTATGTIVSPNTQSTIISNLTAGTFIVRGTVIDDDGQTAFANVKITINAAPIIKPIVVVNDVSITLPVNSVLLDGSGSSDPDGSITSYSWNQIGGAAATNSTPNSSTTTIGGLVEGVYIFNLTVTGSGGAGDVSSKAVKITVNPAPPLLNPVADAGIGQSVQLPANSTTLTGIGTDQDGTITGYSWIQLPGAPNTATGMPSSSASVAIGGLIQGVYNFELTVTDNDGLTGKDTIQIDVLPVPPNIPPVANAGEDIVTISNFVTLNGAGSDNGDTIVSYQWVRISGTSTGDVIGNPNSATTTVSGLQIGTYEYELTVTDGDGATASDRVVISVVETIPVLLRFYKIFP